MPANRTPPRRGGAIYIPAAEVEPYLLNGWHLVGDLTPNEVLVLPPVRYSPAPMHPAADLP